jgi:hypothetical protein
MTLPPCNETTLPGKVCATFFSNCGSFLLPNTTQTPQNNNTNISNELITLTHDRGILFYQPHEGNLTQINQLASNCDYLQIVGTWNDQLFLVHSNSKRCTCQNPGKRPCPLQIEVLLPPSLEGYIDYFDGSVTVPVRKLATNIEGELVLVNSTITANSTIPEEGCSPFSQEIVGRIALVFRGTCFFQEKVDQAEAAGAIAIIVVNRPDTPLFAMGVTGNIPAMMIGYEDGERLRNAILQGEVVVRVGRNTGAILAHPSADLPFGLGTIPLQDILEGKKLSVHPNTEFFNWTNQRFAWDSNRGYLWLFRVDDTPNTLVLDLNNGPENTILLQNYTHSPLSDTYPICVQQGNSHYAAGVFPDGSSVQIFNVTDLNRVELVVEIPSVSANIIELTKNATAMYMANLLTNNEVHVIDTRNISQAKIVHNFTEIPPQLSNVNPGVLFVSQHQLFLWVSYCSEGVTVYNIQDDPLFPRRVAPIVDTNPEITNEYSVGIHHLCGYPAQDLKAVAVNINDLGQQEFVHFTLQKKASP